MSVRATASISWPLESSSLMSATVSLRKLRSAGFAPPHDRVMGKILMGFKCIAQRTGHMHVPGFLNRGKPSMFKDRLRDQNRVRISLQWLPDTSPVPPLKPSQSHHQKCRCQPPWPQLDLLLENHPPEVVFSAKLLMTLLADLHERSEHELYTRRLQYNAYTSILFARYHRAETAFNKNTVTGISCRHDY
ncbi:hypothetical protein GJAV_G00253240 [Gymnothorax javanicus]|nr:hypothetical protein GJAV_G00253240 [Gymnothorax javanicus]